MAKESKAGCQRKNPHFFKVFLPGVTSEHLEVPPGFRKHMEGDLRRCSLMGPSGNLWTVELVRNQAGGLFFGVGWKEFAQDHAMEMGEFAVFIYDGDARFRVLIFDTSACEKEAAFLAFPSKSTVDMDKAKNGHKEMTEELAVDASTRITIKTSEKKGKNRKEEGGKEDPHAAGCRLQEAPPSGCSAEGSHPRAGAPNKIYSRKRRSRGMLVSQRRPVSKEEIERAQTAAKQFTSDNPFHMVTMRKSGVYLGHSMPLPHMFAKRHLPKASQKIILSDSQGNSWEVKYLPLGGTFILSAGWRQFSIDNHLEQDDACVFELIKKDEIRVHIYRVVEEVRPSIRKIIRN